MTRIALDLMGGDDAPDVVVDGALLALAHPLTVGRDAAEHDAAEHDAAEHDAAEHDAAEREAGHGDLEVVLVGPVDVAERLLAERGAAGRCTVVPATQVVTMTEDPARAVRSKRDASVRVAARLVRDGHCDAAVSVGSTGAAFAAAVFTLGRLPGMSRPALAVVVPALAGPVVLLDAGAVTEASPRLLAQFALVGAAYAQVRLALPRPRVGLLTVGSEPGKGDLLRKEAYDALAALPVEFVGNVEGGDVPLGGRADVVVTDGHTGNILLKGLEGTAVMLAAVLADALGPAAARGVAAAVAPLSAEVLGGAVLLGVDGVSVVGHGSASAASVASCIGVAAQAVRQGLLPRLTRALAALAPVPVGAAAVAGEAGP